MSSYNLQKPEDRNRYRQDHAAELVATQDGTWPRDINDAMRWINGNTPEYAARMCKSAIEYIDGLEIRIEAGEVEGLGYEPQPMEGSH